MNRINSQGRADDHNAPIVNANDGNANRNRNNRDNDNDNIGFRPAAVHLQNNYPLEKD